MSINFESRIHPKFYKHLMDEHYLNLDRLLSIQKASRIVILIHMCLMAELNQCHNKHVWHATIKEAKKYERG